MYFTSTEKAAIVKVSVQMIAADGQVKSEEHEITFPVWTKIKVSNSDILEAGEMAELLSCQILSNMDIQKKRFVVAFLASIMMVDGDINDKELALLRLVTRMCNLPAMTAEECMNEMTAFALQ